jgi:hypothetical protein
MSAQLLRDAARQMRTGNHTAGPAIADWLTDAARQAERAPANPWAVRAANVILRESR